MAQELTFHCIMLVSTLLASCFAWACLVSTLNVFMFLLPLRVQLFGTGDTVQLVGSSLSRHEALDQVPSST